MTIMCKRCLFTNRIADVVIGDDGVCNYCIRHDRLDREYPNDQLVGRAELDGMFARVKESGRGAKYDCIVGMSGGCDSSFLLGLISESGLRPLAVYFNNGWDTEVARHNRNSVCQGLGVDLECYSVDSAEFDDIVRSFILAGVPDIDAASDIGMIAALYQVAEKSGVKYIMDGHSFRTEGIQPVSWAYVDGQYISTIHGMFGSVEMKTFPNLWYDDFKRWVGDCGIRRVRPLYNYPYIKLEAEDYLRRRYGWLSYGGHHLENDFTAFNYTYYLPARMQVDERVNEFSALIRSGQLARSRAMAKLKSPLRCPEGLVERVISRLGFTESEFEDVMRLPLRTFRDFRTYKQRFEEEGEFWCDMYKKGVVPKSFYLKYCSRGFM